jgi:adenine-specific DNA-methyltransferase
MKILTLKPRQALNPAFLKIKPQRNEIEVFKSQLTHLLDHISDTESEEFHKNLVSDFLKKTGFDNRFYINTKGRNDLVIHADKTPQSDVAVIIEAKKPTNKAEMLRENNINTKAFQELVLYFLRERITLKNTSLKYLIATNIHEWFIFDAQVFEKAFAQNKELVRQFNDFEAKRLTGANTDFFYREIAQPATEKAIEMLEYTYFNIHDYEKSLRNTNKADDAQLIVLYKLLSAEHLLKLPFANDSNSLDKRFYAELLHVIGLEEIKESGKKLIQRKAVGDRNPASLLENAIEQLESLDKISRINRSQYGQTENEVLFNVALELCITWINRILFLKLLEAQLLAYHDHNKDYAFLNAAKIKDYDLLNKLFFQVLAKKTAERSEAINADYSHVPYLNSSLFEPTELEHNTLFISNLEDGMPLPVLANTVLKDDTGKKRNGKHNAINYLFDFLDAYDFSSEGKEAIQEENKNLINASVLGLIFEKINGYKDGSFFTPGFITMYMCRETIRKAVVQKFNETKGWQCQNTDDLYDKIEDRHEANAIVNSIKIVDPAVGSGHFLVSALNEIIALKHDLKILQDKSGKRLKEYDVKVLNDELIIVDEDAKLFDYKPTSTESQRVQETLFHEKQTIIENCLFGVDINPNSVKICQLRLWIELLKNAYYKSNGQLETLPNIDINIKAGNSLISRFGLDADLSDALKSIKYTVEQYKGFVDDYKNADDKELRRGFKKIIEEIKTNFKTKIDTGFKAEIAKARGTLINIETEINTKKLWGEKLPKDLILKLEKAAEKLAQYEQDKEDVQNNKIYENAFEWRFEFPEVLDQNGSFIGFDVVIGNPPYVSISKIPDMKILKTRYSTFSPTGDLYEIFFELGGNILRKEGVLTFITGSAWLKASHGEPLRKYFTNAVNPKNLIDFSDCQIFEEATVLTTIVQFLKQVNDDTLLAVRLDKNLKDKLSDIKCYFEEKSSFLKNLNEKSWVINEQSLNEIKTKIEIDAIPLKDCDIKINRGILTGFNDAYYISKEQKEAFVKEDSKNAEILKPLLRGRDITRFGANFAELYLINTQNGESLKVENLEEDIKIEDGYNFVKINNNWTKVNRIEYVKGNNIRINRVIVEEDYPVIYQYLKRFESELKSRLDQGNHWTNLRNCAYLGDFEKEKIIYPNMTKFFPFMYDDSGICTNQKCYIMGGSNLKFLTAFFNSKLFKYCYTSDFPELLGNVRELNKNVFEQIRVKQFESDSQTPIISKVEEILALKKADIGADTSVLESEIDVLVYALYGLTEAEITVVEGV